MTSPETQKFDEDRIETGVEGQPLAPDKGSVEEISGKDLDMRSNPDGRKIENMVGQQQGYDQGNLETQQFSSKYGIDFENMTDLQAGSLKNIIAEAEAGRLEGGTREFLNGMYAEGLINADQYNKINQANLDAKNQPVTLQDKKIDQTGIGVEKGFDPITGNIDIAMKNEGLQEGQYYQLPDGTWMVGGENITCEAFYSRCDLARAGVSQQDFNKKFGC